MFCNLKAEQARKGLTNKDVAGYLGISVTTYLSKRRSGRFTAKEIFALCTLFSRDFEYLFHMDKNEGKEGKSKQNENEKSSRH